MFILNEIKALRWYWFYRFDSITAVAVQNWHYLICTGIHPKIDARFFDRTQFSNWQQCFGADLVHAQSLFWKKNDGGDKFPRNRRIWRNYSTIIHLWYSRPKTIANLVSRQVGSSNSHWAGCWVLKDPSKTLTSIE